MIGLLIVDPGLGTSFGFLLSVLATLGPIVLGRQFVDWGQLFMSPLKVKLAVNRCDICYQAFTGSGSGAYRGPLNRRGCPMIQ